MGRVLSIPREWIRLRACPGPRRRLPLPCVAVNPEASFAGRVSTRARRPETILFSLFIILLLLVGLRSFRDYGIPYDEGTLSQLGMESYASVFEGKPYPDDPHFRFHGTAVELPLHAALTFFGPFDSVTIAYARRFTVFAFFLLAVISFYVLAKKLLKDWRLALLGSLSFVLSPRVFAHGFYNSRDIPTMALFTLAMLTLMRLLEKKTLKRAVLHGIICGLALGIRMPSLFLIPFTFLFLLIDALMQEGKRGQSIKQAAMMTAVFTMTTFLTTYAVWPLLWEHPIKHFLDAYAFMSQIDSKVQFLGQTYEGLPWFYVPAWIAMTTPILLSVFFLIGCAVLLMNVLRDRLQLVRRPDLPLLLPILWFFLPLLLLILQRSAIYQEWRHVLFLYPAFLLISLHGVRWLMNIADVVHVGTIRGSTIFTSILAMLLLATTGRWMWQNHPHQYVYYSIQRETISPSLELDYWGLSTRDAIQYIVDHDPRPLISYYSPQNLALLNGSVFFKPNGIFRAVPVTNPDVADYAVELHQPQVPSLFEDQRRLFSVLVDEMRLVSVYEGTGSGKTFMNALREGKKQQRELQQATASN